MPTTKKTNSSEEILYLVNDGKADLFFEGAVDANAMVTVSPEGHIESEEVIGVRYKRTGQDKLTKARGGPFTATNSFRLGEGAQPVFYRAKELGSLEEPYIGKELFFLPKTVLAMKSPKEISGVEILASNPNREPSFVGKWAYSTHPIPDDQNRRQRPGLL